MKLIVSDSTRELGEIELDASAPPRVGEQIVIDGALVPDSFFNGCPDYMGSVDGRPALSAHVIEVVHEFDQAGTHQVRISIDVEL